MTQEVYLLSHLRPENDYQDEHWKIIGIYASEEHAKAAILRSSNLPGFRDFPKDFNVSKYTLNKDHWITGCIFDDY